MEFSAQLTPKDWQAFQKVTMRNAQARLRSWKFGFGLNLLLWMVITAVFTVVFQSFQKLDVFTVMFSSAIFTAIFAFVFLQQKRLVKALQPDEDSDVMRLNTYIIETTGITVKNDYSNCWYSWDNVKSIHQDKDCFILYLDNLRGIVFNTDNLPNGFIDFAHEQTVLAQQK